MAPEPADAGLVDVARGLAARLALHPARDVAPVHLRARIAGRGDHAALHALVRLDVVRRRETTRSDEAAENADTQLAFLRGLAGGCELPGPHVGEVRSHRLELARREALDVEQQ